MVATRPAPTATRPVPTDLLRCTGLTRSFGDRRAVDGVSFTIAPGETYGLLGPNGAGKTTTIRMVCGLLAADAGTVTVGGQRIAIDDPHGKAQVGYVPQDVALYPDLSAAENLRFFGRLYRLRGRALAGRVAEVLELVGLTDRADDRVESYSGGMRRRLNIAAGLVHQPMLLVLDEPTVGVDPQSRHAILESVRRFREAGMAVLYTTHYMEEAQRLCDRIAIMDHGQFIAEGTQRELVALLGSRDRIELSASGNLDAFAQACREIDGVERVDVGGTDAHLLAGDARAVLPLVLDAARHAGVLVRSVEVVEPDLEAVFLHLTGTALRE